MSDLNQSAIRKHALKCSAQHRAGKFRRVGQEFLDEINVEVESIIRDLRNNRFAVTANDAMPTTERFVTGPLLEKVREALDAAIGRIIQNAVQRQPSVGVTLGRTK